MMDWGKGKNTKMTSQNQVVTAGAAPSSSPPAPAPRWELMTWGVGFCHPRWAFLPVAGAEPLGTASGGHMGLCHWRGQSREGIVCPTSGS